ncbi:MAG TPA: hypothetical protein G4N92_01790 [Anaerolineae bacterium]|nr:hypothetical protein [Anaerolineae bacterium]
MFRDVKGPILNFSWGKFIVIDANSVSNKAIINNDLCLIGTQFSVWKERKGHTLKPLMVERVLDKDIGVLVIGTGVLDSLKVKKKTIRALKEHGIEKIVIQPTGKACKTYNKLFRRGDKVALLAHNTC